MNQSYPHRTFGNCHRILQWFAVFAMALACQAAMAAGPYTYNALGDEVTDTATGLVWKRCSVGQTWANGTCSGTATNMSHEQALTHAASLADWRLPNVKELSSLVDSSRVSPAINMVSFPNSISNYYWSASPYAGNPSVAWLVGFGNGNVSHSLNRSTGSYYVRLVR